MKTLKEIELTPYQKKALIDSWNDILSGKKRDDRPYILTKMLQVLKNNASLLNGTEVRKEVIEEVQRFINESARIRDLIQKDSCLKKYHSLEAYCHDVTVAIKSFLHVDAVTLNIHRVRDGEGACGELIPHGWSAGETSTFITKRIRIKRGSNPNLAGKLFDSTKPINIPNYGKEKKDWFEFKKEAERAGFESSSFIPLRTTNNKFVGNIALHSKRKGCASGDFFESFLEALIVRLSSNLKESHWKKVYKFLLSRFCYQRMREFVRTISLFPLKGLIIISMIIFYCMVFLHHCYDVPKSITFLFSLIILSFIASGWVFLCESKEFINRFREDVYYLCKNKLREKGPIISYGDFLVAGNEVRHDLSKSVRKEILFLGSISLVVLLIMISCFWFQYKVILHHDEACITKEHQLAGSNDEKKIFKKCSSFDGNLKEEKSAILLAISRISNAESWNDSPTKPLSKCLLSVQSFSGYLWLLFITLFLITIVVYKSNYWKQLMDGELDQIERHLRDTNYINWWWDPVRKKSTK